MVSSSRGDCAYVCLIYGAGCENYFFGACTIAWSLIRHFSLHPRVLLYTSDVPRAILDVATASGLFTEIIQTEYIEASEVFFSNPRTHRRFGKIFTKYRVLGLDKYAKIMFLDADLYIKRSLDHLFQEIEAPAAVARGPRKPPHGHTMPARTPINAGVMLLRPDAALLERILQDVTSKTLQRLHNHDSPDADYLTEHALKGQWTSLSLAYNFQLEFEHLDAKKGTVRLSAARAAHFSDEGAAMDWESLKVIRFSGMKPWRTIMKTAAALASLKAQPTQHIALGQKLVQGLREYMEEVSKFQGLCSQLQLGEGLLWRELRQERILLGLRPEAVRTQLQVALPVGGHWYEGQRPHTAVWIPPSEGLRLKDDAALGRCSPVGAYLEICAVDHVGFRVGDTIYPLLRGVRKEFRVTGYTDGIIKASRQVVLPPNWQMEQDPKTDCPYYYNIVTKEVQWEFPDLPANWQAVTAAQGNATYYHNIDTDATQWDPPTVEDIEVSPDGVDAAASTEGGVGCEVIIVRRSFMRDESVIAPMREAMSGLMMK